MEKATYTNVPNFVVHVHVLDSLLPQSLQTHQIHVKFLDILIELYSEAFNVHFQLFDVRLQVFGHVDDVRNLLRVENVVKSVDFITTDYLKSFSVPC
jgi:hypothetical protein